MAYSDRELLARLIQCEAGGEGDTGMKAVAGVVMNRVHARGGEYARVGRGSIRNIIFQPYQFVCASETEQGRLQPPEYFQYAAGADPLRHCRLGHRGEPHSRCGRVSVVLQSLRPSVPEQVSL